MNQPPGSHPHDDELAADTRAPKPAEVEQETVIVSSTGAPAPPADVVPPPPFPDEIVEEAPGIVSETERVRTNPDGSFTRELDRVEQPPLQRRRVNPVGPILLVFLIAVLAALAALWYFTQEDEKAVPAVEGLALDDAVARLQDEGFKTNIVSQASSREQGIVFDQRPEGSVQAEEGSTVDVVVSKGPDTVAVPNAIGVNEATARDRLAAAGLQVRVVEVFSDEPDGNIVAQNPPAGDKVDEATSVRLNVSKGTGLVDVPNLVGRLRGDAESELSGLGLKANVVEVPSAQPAGTVVAQNPASGKARQGSAIRLNVSSGSG